MRSWLGRASSFLERAEELVSRFDIVLPTLARAPLPCSPMEGPPHVVVEPPSAATGVVVVQGMVPVPLHEGDEAGNKGTPTAVDASPTFTSITPSSSPPSLMGSQCLLHLSRNSPFLVRDISAEFETTPLGMPVTPPILLKKTGFLLASPRRSGRIAQQKKKLPIFKSKDASKKKKKPSVTVMTIPKVL